MQLQVTRYMSDVNCAAADEGPAAAQFRAEGFTEAVESDTDRKR